MEDEHDRKGSRREAIRTYEDPTDLLLQQITCEVTSFRKDVESHLLEYPPSLERMEYCTYESDDEPDEGVLDVQLQYIYRGGFLSDEYHDLKDESNCRNRFRETVMARIIHHYITRIQWEFLKPRLINVFLTSTVFPHEIIHIVLSFLERFYWDANTMYLDQGNLHTVGYAPNDDDDSCETNACIDK